MTIFNRVCSDFSARGLFLRAAFLCFAFIPLTSASGQTLWVTGTDALGVYDIATGAEKKVFDVAGRTADLHALPNGYVVLNHRAAAQLVLFDSKTLSEAGRMPSSMLGGINPHHGYVLKTGNAELYAVLHDGEEADKNSTLALFRITAGAPGLTYAGEIRLGAGHHKLAHFPGQNWVSASNINDCENVVQVIDITDPASPKTISKIAAKNIGFDGTSAEKTCDASGKVGRKLSPHGAGATEAYHAHNLNGTGHMVVVRADGSSKSISTGGTGGASAVAHNGQLYLTQFTPRAGVASGSACQIGQVVVLGKGGELAGQIPLLKEPGCTEDAQGARLGYVSLAADGETLLFPLGTLGANAQPAAGIVRAKIRANSLAQVPSLNAGSNLGHRDHGWSGSLWAFPNNKANSVTVVDTLSGKPVSTVQVVIDPLRVAITP